MGKYINLIFVLGVFVCISIGVVRRFHPKKLDDGYRKVTIEKDEGQLLVEWQNLRRFEIESRSVTFVFFVSRKGKYDCTQSWHELNVDYKPSSADGSVYIDIPELYQHKGVFAVCAPENVWTFSKGTNMLPCDMWYYGRLRDSTQATCKFDDAGWGVMFVLAYGIWFGITCYVVCCICDDSKTNDVIPVYNAQGRPDDYLARRWIHDYD